MPAQHGLRGVEIPAVRDHFAETFVLDLVHVDRRIPGGEQHRRADAIADLGGQRVHLVAEDRLAVGRIRHRVTSPHPRRAQLRSSASSLWRSTWNGDSPGHSARTISSPGSSPRDWMTSSRPPGASRRTSGSSTLPTLNCADMRARQGCEARMKS